MYNTKKLFIGVGITFVLMLLFSCKTRNRYKKDFNYFQGIADTVKTTGFVEQKLVANDLITIQVISGSARQDDASVFNAGSLAGAIGSLNNGYQIDLEGYIEIAKIGKIKAAGLTKQELAKSITAKIVDEVKNPVVIVKYAQFKINVLGEVKKPGTVIFKSDKVNILEAIAEAGDLTEAGERSDILVMRQINGKYETFKVNLLNTSFLNTPIYQIQQNDVIYVGTNINRLRGLNFNLNTQKDITTALTLLSALTLIVNTIIIIRRF